MPDDTDTSVENSRSDPNPEAEFEALWRRLSDSQRRYVIARQDCGTKADAAEEIGLTASTVYNWPDYVDEAAERLVDQAKATIQAGLDSASAAAVQRLKEIVEDGGDKQARQAAEYIIDQQIGRATQQQDIDMNATIDGIDVQVHSAGAPEIDDGK
jgi:hypothetical protein